MAEAAISLSEDRYARFAAISWWRQDRLRSARVLVIGAGALGNEVLKNFALLGVGDVVVADLDRVEASNLTRSVLFSAADTGRPKAEVAAARMRAMCPDTQATALVGNVLADVGLGWFRRADVVIGALDNREARVFVNQACSRLGRPWFDGGIEVLNGIVRGFHPPHTPCYECTMTAADWSVLNQRRSCSMLARQALAARGTPTTPTTGSVIGAMQAQEAIKLLHGLEHLRGAGWIFEGLGHASYRCEYQQLPDCPWHEPVPEVHAPAWCGHETTLTAVAEYARSVLGGLDAIDLPRELVETLTCDACGRSDACNRPLEALDAAAVQCPGCGAERAPRACHSIAAGSIVPDRTLGGIGLPRFDIIFARCGERSLGIEMGADAPAPGGQVA